MSKGKYPRERAKKTRVLAPPAKASPPRGPAPQKQESRSYDKSMLKLARAGFAVNVAGVAATCLSIIVTISLASNTPNPGIPMFNQSAKVGESEQRPADSDHGTVLKSKTETAVSTNTNLEQIGVNAITSMRDLPGIQSGVSYMTGTLLGRLDILKIKDHIENPNNIPLKNGAIKLAAGGGLFALPILYSAMQNRL